MGRVEMLLEMFRHRLSEAKRMADEAERAAQGAESPEVRQTAMLATAFFRGVASAYEYEIEGIEDAMAYSREIERQDAQHAPREQERDWN